MKKCLSDLKVNDRCKIVSVDSNIHLRRRLLELGLFLGQEVQILAISPLNNTFLIAIKNYTLALRKNILQSIYVECKYE